MNALRRFAFAVLLLLTALYASLPALAAVPHEKAEPAYAEEQTILQLEQGQREPGLTSRQSGIQHSDRHSIVMPGLQGEYNVILQRGGNLWRQWRNEPLAWAAAVVLLVTLIGIAVFHKIVGPAEAPPVAPGERPLLRFTRSQRWVHWFAAITFVVLAITGIVILYGKNILLPWMGHDVFSWVALGSKWLHNISGPLFVIASLVMFVTYLRHNHFERADVSWVLRLGGMFSRSHVPAPYFNAGEKLWFWIGVTLLGLLMAVTGLMLNFPYFGDVGSVIALTRYQLQWANGLHLVGAALYLAAGFGHIYLGTLGSPGAWQAMRHGNVSEGWARAHHRLWYDDVKRNAAGRAP